LSQHPGPEFGRAAATALLGADAGPDLDGLATAGLLQRRADDRYQFHELLRVYATELAATDPERDAAAARLFDCYQRMTACVDRRWLDAERVNLIAAINQGRHPHAWQLADHLRDYLETELHVSDLQTACTAGLQAAVDAADLAGQAAMHSGLAIVGYYVGEMPDSIAHDQAALDLYRQAGSREGEAHSLGQLGIDALLTGDVRAGAAYLEECLAILDDLGAHQLRTAPLVNLAIARLEQGRPAEAARLCTSELASSTRAARYDVRLRLARVEALRQLRRYDDAAAVLAIVAAVDADSRPMHQQLVATATAQLQGERGDLDYAEHQARTAVELATRTRHPWEECRARNILGDTLLRRGQLRPAAEAHDEAYRLAERNGYRGAQAEALVGLARAERDPATAARYADRALDLVAGLGLRALERRAAEARDAIGASVDAALG
jgi:tetratricopeptide (TPR) repeat protein